MALALVDMTKRLDVRLQPQIQSPFARIRDGYCWSGSLSPEVSGINKKAPSRILDLSIWYDSIVVEKRSLI